MYKEHKQGLKRKRNNECASKFRKKRKNYEKINEIIRTHLNELAKHCKGNLTQEHVEKIRLFLTENKLNITLKYFDEDYCFNKSINENSSSSKSHSVMSSISSENSDSSDSSDSSSTDSVRTDVEKMYIHKNHRASEMKEEPIVPNFINKPTPLNLSTNTQEIPMNPITANMGTYQMPHQFLTYAHPFANITPQNLLQHQQHQQQQQQHASTGIFAPVILVPNPYSGEYQLLLNPLSNQRVIIK